MSPLYIWGFPKIRGTFLGVPVTRIVVFGGPHWGTPILGNYHIYIIRYLFELGFCADAGSR